MAIDAAILQAYRELERRMADAEPSDHLGALRSIPAIIGYLCSAAKADGCTEYECADQVELLVSEAGLDRDQVKEAANLLHRLGYGEAIVDRLKRLARRARKTRSRAKRVAMVASSHRGSSRR